MNSKSPKKARRKRNRGWFKKGDDPRRSSYQLTRQDRWLGYAVTYYKHPHLRAWLKRRVYLQRLEREVPW